MSETFQRSGIAFRYPGEWTLEDDTEHGDWTVTLQTADSALMIVTFREDADPAELADETLTALQDDYPDLDSEIAIETIAGRMAVGHDIDFLTLDTPVAARVRSLDTPEGALLLFWQCSETEKSHYDPLFGAVVASLTIESSE